jgi:hypothetical protein
LALTKLGYVSLTTTRPLLPHAPQVCPKVLEPFWRHPGTICCGSIAAAATNGNPKRDRYLAKAIKQGHSFVAQD